MDQEDQNGWWYLSKILGWIYFFAWSMSFYPQTWENYKRKRYISFIICSVFRDFLWNLLF